MKDLDNFIQLENLQSSSLSPKDRHQLLIEWNQTQTDYPKNQCVHQIFEAQVRRSPHAEAIAFKDEKLTYEELNHRANQLACYLRSLGIGSEDLVGVCVEQSAMMVVALLAILKAGGAYVPLDPSHPTERLNYTIADARIEVLLTQPPFTQQFESAEFGSLKPFILCLEEAKATIREQSPDNLPCHVSAEHLAYVIYTSGSTGKPKGVAVAHRAINRLVLNTNYIQFDPSNRVAQVSNAAFDAATFEIWGALLNGAHLVGIPKNSLLSPHIFADRLQAHKIDILFLTTALVNYFAKTSPKMFQSVKTLLFGGEAVDPASVRIILENGPQRLLHVYGPTENTTFSSWYSIQSVPDGAKTLPIGRPIANTQLYVLDRDLQPVPVGEPGELYVGGDGLARGYLNRSELNEERFIPNPFITENPSASPSERLYRTGDWVRYRSDGNVEFLGRIDTQVKIRGFRVELSEIEIAIAQHPEVEAAVVTAREVIINEGDRVDKRLVAYLVPRHPGRIPQQLPEFYQEKLPDYMRPAAVVLLERLPLTPNGKIDRKALPDPDWKHPNLDTPYVAPRNEIEAQVLTIWIEILGIDRIGIHDRLFDLGGHSLTATRILGRVYDRFLVKLPLDRLFEKPTIAHLVDLIEQSIPTEDRTLSIQSIPKVGYLPVSFAQERVYFLEKLATNRAYQFQASLRFKGHLQIEALQQSFEEIVRRHEIFRTTFVEVDGRPWQVVRPAPEVELPVVDIQGIPESDRETEVQRLILEAVQKPFDVTRLPLVRQTLVKLSDREHILIYIEHHMVHDGWSFNIFLRELTTLYKAFSSGKPSPLPEPTLQFADFARWQRQWVQGDGAKQQLLYWQKKLSGSLPLLELPCDRPRPTEQTYQGSSLRTELPVSLCESLRKLSRQTEKTLFMTMFAAFSILVHRYTGQEDFNIGTAVANRQISGSEGLIGMIVNNLVLRADLSGDPSFKTLLDRVRQVTLEGYANEDLPFDKVVDGVNPMRNLSHNPLFQVMFSFHDSPLSDLTLPELELELYEAISNQSAKFDLDVVVIPRSEQRVGPGTASDGSKGITMVWEFNGDIFDAATIERMMGHYQTLLENIIAQPEQHVSEFSLLAPQQQQQILVEWNDTQAEYPLDRCIQQLFEEQVERTPDKVAVYFKGQTLTYRELNTKADRLACYLQTLGVGSGTLVGLCLDRSLEMLVGLWGILKAGGTYVPLDPAYPPDRLAYMARDAQISVLMTKEQWRSLWENIEGIQFNTICLDRQWEQITQNSEQNPTRVNFPQPDNLAYVIYTSGSTGQPKGVEITQRSLVNFTRAVTKEYGIVPEDRILQFAPISFDTAAEEIYPCLCCGGTLILRTEEMLTSTSAFVQQSEALQLTVWDLPTAYWHLLCSELASGAIALPASLRSAIVGGERMQPERVEMWRHAVGDAVELINGYGPTEGTVVATASHLSWGLRHSEREDQTSENAEYSDRIDKEVPIGRPIPNVCVYVLDRYLQPVPIGIPGELHIGGAGVARGYLNRPELTREKFIPNPFGHGRLYKTGDLVRYLPDGNLEYLGRIDAQVKVRGFRIEPGEIEAVLDRYPQVSQAVVTVREDVPGNKRLVAYLVSAASPQELQEIRHSLKQKLPPYMIPAAFVGLDKLPLTPSGKVDYKVLPAPHETPELDTNTGNDEPRTLAEERLVRIWADILGLSRVGIHDNFFELGGDSIISIQMVSQAARGGLKLTPKQLFQYQTIAELARVASQTVAIAAEQGSIAGVVPLTPIQQWFWEQQLPDSHYFNQSIRLESQSRYNPENLKIALQQLLHHHDLLRSRWKLNEGKWQQQILEPDEKIPFQVIDLSKLDAIDREKEIADVETKLQESLDLMDGPILRATLFYLGVDRPEYLSIVVHHLAIDGISWRILLEDLAAVYQQLERHQSVRLPAKTTAFATWADRLLSYATSSELATELEYWTNVNHTGTLLPVDYPCDIENPASRAIAATASVTACLSRDETHALLQEIPATYNTRIDDVLLTALLQSMAQWTQSNTLRVDLEGHGREDLFEDVDLSRTLGWFTTLFPVSLTLPAPDEGAESVGEVLKSVKEQLRHIPQRGIGYGILRYLHPDEEIRTQLQALPASQISFNYLGQFERGLSGSTSLGTPAVLKSEQSPKGHRSHLLGISGWIRAGQLEMTFTYSDRVHRRVTIEHLSSQYLDALKTLIDHCQSPEVGGYTPSDFSASKLNQKQLDKLMSRINRTQS
ncbi:MAG: amino acid adenylation domain-containing protein [Cyanobacteria bacterium SBLK]|nr:amino acid adenylation domain-containing protein [Cyanobacteria bacterium SBLK]